MENDQTSRLEILSHVLCMMSNLPGYADWKFEKITRLVAPTIFRGNFLFRSDGTAFSAWEYLGTGDCENYLRNNGNVDFRHMHNSGDELLISHFIAFGDAAQFMRDTLTIAGMDNPRAVNAWGLRGFKDGRVCRIKIPRD